MSRTGRGTTSQSAVMVVVCIALGTVIAATASLNVALPDIARATHASQTQLEWVIDAYSLIFAALLLPAGALGDKYGRRLALIVGLSIYAAGSAAAMLVSSADTLILLRGALGVGAALVMPATLSTITSTFPADQRDRAVSIWAGVAGASAVIGLLSSGIMLRFWSWPSVFGLNVVLGVLALIGTLRYVPESADSDAPRIDVVGALLAAAGLLVLVFSIIEAPDNGWLAPRTLGGMAAAAVVLAGFVAWELHHDAPMLDPRVFRNARLSAGTLSILVQFFAFFGFTFTVLQYLQIIRGDSPILASVSVLPLAGGMLPVSRLTPTLVARFGPRRVCAAGLSLMAVGFVILAQLGTDTSYWLMVGGLVPLGVGMGAAMTPATSAISDALPSAQQGVGSALNDLSRELGGALGIAVLGSVLAATYRHRLPLPGVPAAIAAKARDSVAIASRIGGPISESAHHAFMDGMHFALYGAAAASVAAAIAVAVMLRPHQVESAAQSHAGVLVEV